MFSAFSPRSASAYQRISVETSTMDQHQLVSLLYDGILKAIASARGALARGDVPTKCASISKAVRIIEEGLLTALDREAGGEVAASLGSVYEYALRRLIQANAANDDAMLQEVARLIDPIAQGWSAIRNPRPQDAANDTLRLAAAEA
ncbi:flagellar export chaperone FliS [Melaminivora suipulveris]|uniref:Flagellar secretion chaperone FliS n=1 Tax=Melaminivora suipulveris TaxID=2109913 RepID=A0A2R3QD84_9BURK|nr:flagellar export chaperone FliS [Melaminivora suipulveris]AVO49741.1 flagellar export chaperone FliS [Melaminivora suipulveris]